MGNASISHFLFESCPAVYGTRYHSGIGHLSLDSFTRRALYQATYISVQPVGPVIRWHCGMKYLLA